MRQQGSDQTRRYTYTVPEVADLLDVSERTVYRRLEGQGDLAEIAPGIPAIRVGRRWVVPRAPLHAALGLPEDAELVTANSE